MARTSRKRSSKAPVERESRRGTAKPRGKESIQRVVGEIYEKIERANRQRADVPAGRRGRKRPIEPSEARAVPGRGRTRRRDEPIPPADSQAPLRPGGKTLPPGTTPKAPRGKGRSAANAIQMEGAVGASDATSRGGAGAGVPDADMLMELGHKVGEGDVKELRERAFGGRKGRQPAADREEPGRPHSRASTKGRPERRDTLAKRTGRSIAINRRSAETDTAARQRARRRPGG